MPNVFVVIVFVICIAILWINIRDQNRL